MYGVCVFVCVYPSKDKLAILGMEETHLKTFPKPIKIGHYFEKLA